MKEVTQINDTACLRGAFKSILKDSQISDEKMNSILSEIESRTDGNNTYIASSEVKSIVKDLFNSCEVISIKSLEDIAKVRDEIDNENSFALLMQNGSSGINRHATRFLSEQEGTITVMDSTKGSNTSYEFSKIQPLSTEGIDLVIMQK